MSKTLWDVWQAIQHLAQRVEVLEQENRDLRRKMEERAVEAKRPFKVKKIVYHVHALHIQEMKGTMNIGITAPLDEAEMERLVLEMQREED